MVNAISAQGSELAAEPPMGLSEAAQLARDLAEAHRLARLGTWRWVIATDIVTWSEEVYRAFDLDPSLPPPGYAALEETHTAESWARLQTAVHRAVSEGEPYEIDVEIVSQLGHRKWIIARGEAAAWADGQVTQLRGTIQDITERKVIELSLREREQELQEVHRIAGLGSWRWVRGTNTATWSSEMYEIFGRDPALPAPGMAEMPRFYTPASRARLDTAMQRAVAVGESFELDLEAVRADGTTRWITVCCVIEAVLDGQVERIRGTVQDITGRKRVELALRARELELEEVHRVARLGTWRWNRLTDTAAWSPEVYAMFGRDPALGAPNFAAMQALYTPASRERRALAVRRALADKEPYAVDLEILHPDGTTRWVAARGLIDALADGEVTELRGTFQDITERKRAEEAVARSEARYRSVLDSITDGLLVLDTDWRYTYFSEQGARILGVRVEDMVGGCVWELFPHAEQTKFGATYREAVATGKPVHFDEFYPAPLNKWLECHCYPSAEGLSVYFRDITEQRVAEAAARESQARFQKLYEVNLVGVCFPDRFGAFSEGNDEFLRIVGYSRDDLAAGLVRWDVMTPPRYAAIDAAGIAEAIAHGRCTPYEKEYLRKDGSLVPILCGYALLKGSSDEFLGFILDLTAQKQAERAVREREQRFSTLADSLPQLVWMSAPDGRKIYVNQPFLAYTGMAPEQVPSFEWSDLVHPDDLDAMMQLRARAMVTGELYMDNFRIRRHDGMYRSFLSRALAMRNEAGEIVRWMGSATDVHDQKLAEDMLRRTEKLAATGRLAASIAHEINNPLEAVTNSLYLALQDEALGEDTRFYLKQAEQELARVAHVTTQTLRFHRQSVAAIEVDLAEVMDSAFGLYAARFMAFRIGVEREYTKGQMLFCRGEEMRQVFSNLVGNALDATRKGGRVRLRIRPVHDGAGVAGMRVTIADTGHGIPVALRRKIFEPFISTKETTGTGLGLWVSEEIVQKHKGRIVLRSRTEEGEGRHGTVFALFFPADGIKSATPAAIDDQNSPK